MFLLISIGLACIYATLKPFSDGIFDTSLWLAKITTPSDVDESDVTKQLLKVNQAALLGNWLSNFPFINSILFVACVILGFFYTWWAGLMMFIVTAFLGGTTKFFFTRSVSYYIFVIYHSMVNRAVNYKMKNDISRAEAAEDYSKELAEIIIIYEGCRLKPPTKKKLKDIPYGHVSYLLESA